VDGSIRPAAQKDRAAIKGILIRTRAFRPAEIKCALEVFDAGTQTRDSGYNVFVFIGDNAPLGYVCYGPTPLTEGTFDIYWIAVDPRFQHQGIGWRLLMWAEEAIAAAGGRLIILQTSSQSAYEAPRRLYRRSGYILEGTIANYYSPGDDMLIYTKSLQP
jgi:ribosomal protein S18 acetylase RimI-like enzyme